MLDMIYKAAYDVEQIMHLMHLMKIKNVNNFSLLCPPLPLPLLLKRGMNRC